MGSLLLASSVISWIAANWTYASVFQKLAGIQTLLVLLVLLTVWLLNTRPYKHTNFSVAAQTGGLAAVGLGGLLALVGQIYQTGADPWQLFMWWVVLLLPWLLSLHTVFMGLLVAALLNIVAVLYVDAVQAGAGYWIGLVFTKLGLMMLVLNALMLAAWEAFAERLDDRWRIGQRALGIGAGAWAIGAVVADTSSGLVGLLVMALACWWYTHKRRDVALVAVAGMAALSIIAILLISQFDSAEALLLIIFVLLALTGVVLAYLRRLLAHARPTTPPEQQEAVVSTDPWFISLFRLAAMVFTAVLVIGFLYMFLDIRSEQLWIIGLLSMVVGVLILRASGEGALHEAGATLTCAGLFMLGAGVYLAEVAALDWRPWALVAAAVLVYGLGRGFALRWLATVFCLSLVLLITWPHGTLEVLVSDFLDNHSLQVQAYLPAYLRLWWLAIFAILALVVSSNAKLGGRWSPMAWGLVVLAQALATVVPVFGFTQWLQIWLANWPVAMLSGVTALLPVVALAALLRSAKALPPVLRTGAPLMLAVACLAWVGAPGVALGLLWLILGFAQRRRSLLIVGVLSTVVYLGVFYYQMEMTLLHKSFLLGATGLWLIASWLVLRRAVGSVTLPVAELLNADVVSAQSVGVGTGHTEPITAVPPNVVARPHKPDLSSRWRIAGLLVGLTLILGVVNGTIYRHENTLAHGKEVVLELAPVDPRSLMQGDYMALTFDVARQLNQLWSSLPEEVTKEVERRSLGYVFLVPDERGIHHLHAVGAGADQQKAIWDEPQGTQQAMSEFRVSDEQVSGVMLEFRRSNRGIRLVTDAWFFPEGQDQHYARAKYGKIRVSAQGTGLLEEMLDVDLERL